MTRHLNRRTGVAVAAALLAPAVLLTPAIAGVVPANAATAGIGHVPAADTAEDPGKRPWWESPRAADGDGSAETTGQGVRDDAENPQDQAARDFAAEEGFAAQRPSAQGEEADAPAPSRSSAPAGEEPAAVRSGTAEANATDGATSRGTEATATDGATSPGAEANATDGATSPGAEANATDSATSAAPKAGPPPTDEESEVQTPNKSFAEGRERVRRGVNSDIPKDREAQDKGAEPAEAKSKAKPAKVKSGKKK